MSVFIPCNSGLEKRTLLASVNEQVFPKHCCKCSQILICFEKEMRESIEGKKKPQELIFVPELEKCLDSFLDRRLIYLTKKFLTQCYQAHLPGLVIASWF